MALSVSIELVSSSARVTSVKSAQRLVLTSGPKDRTPGLPGSDENIVIVIVKTAVLKNLLIFGKKRLPLRVHLLSGRWS